jgi:hypothetical protein
VIFGDGKHGTDNSNTFSFRRSARNGIYVCLQKTEKQDGTKKTGISERDTAAGNGKGNLTVKITGRRKQKTG